MAESPTVSFKVSVGDQTFRVKIPAEERGFYERAADFTESAYQEICNSAVTGGPQAWAMAAFQIACDLLESQENAGKDVEGQARIQRLIRRIEDVTSKV